MSSRIPAWLKLSGRGKKFHKLTDECLHPSPDQNTFSPPEIVLETRNDPKLSSSREAQVQTVTCPVEEMQQMLEFLGTMDQFRAESDVQRRLQTDQLKQFLDAFLVCTESLELHNSRREKDLQNMLSTIEHLEFRSYQQKQTILRLKEKHRHYEGQIRKIQRRILQYKHWNKELNQSSTKFHRNKLSVLY